MHAKSDVLAAVTVKISTFRDVAQYYYQHFVFYLEDGGSRCLRNVNKDLREHMSTHPTGQQTFERKLWILFGRCSVLVSGGTPPILTEDFCFPQSFQANAGIVSQLYRDSFLLNPFQCVYYTLIQLYKFSMLISYLNIQIKIDL